MTTRNAVSMGTFGSTWQTGGYSGQGNIHPLLNILEGRVAIVCGGSHKVFDDLEKVLDKLSDLPVVFAVNDIGMFMKDVDHWVTLHSQNLKAWRAVRYLQARPSPKMHCVDWFDSSYFVWDALTPIFALSGYFAMQVAHLMGADKIILCGVPGSPARRFFDEKLDHGGFGYGGGSTQNDRNIRDQLVKEMARVPEFYIKIRSMSGWTQEFFGGL